MPTRSLAVALGLLFAVSAFAQDVFIPPVPIGIKGEGKTRTPRGPIRFPAEDLTWIRVRSPHFDIISSAEEARTRAIANDLEVFASTLARASSRFEPLARVPATVFVFARRRESQPYFDLLVGRQGTRVQGLYVRHEEGGTMFIDATRVRFERTVMHELIHDLLRQSDIVPPLWVEEGLAEYFSIASVRGSLLVAGGFGIAEHIAIMRRMRNLTAAEMFAVRAESELATDPLFYAQSWAAVHWLMQLDSTRFFVFLRDVENGVPEADALQAHYGKTIAELEDVIRRTGRGGRAVRIRPEILFPTANQQITTAVTKLDRATLLFELGRFLSFISGTEEETQRHYRAALDVNPNHTRTLAAVGQFEAAIGADPSNAEVHLTYAETLLGDAIGPFAGVFEAEPTETPKFRKARELALRALALGAEEGRTRGTIGVTYLVEGDFTPAILHLERARELSPARMDFALHLYALHLRSGAREKADALFAAAFERSRDKQIVFAARNLLLRFETDHASALSKSGKLDEAAAIVRRLATQTADARARRELEQQADQLAATAAVNRHIELYNRAVAASNAGQKREAVRIVNELLRIATDPDVVRDAQRLRSELRKP
ncbi:MAG TPA: DUF1570 domain-containing protein [Thermoanaerobaculia bacterium]|nr:DUF1570 domain-containing protein [Thermoanaerobaculia bacterium]